MRKEELRDNDLWLKGPEWLLSLSNSWPVWSLKNMDNDMAKQTNAEIMNNVIYEAKLMTGKGCLSTHDESIKVKVSAPLNIHISGFHPLQDCLE